MQISDSLALVTITAFYRGPPIHQLFNSSSGDTKRSPSQPATGTSASLQSQAAAVPTDEASGITMTAILPDGKVMKCDSLANQSADNV